MLGPFYTSASYLELSQLCGNFSGMEVLELLTSAQVAQFTVDLLLGDTDSNMLFSYISEITMTSSFQENIDEFFYQFKTSALQQNLTVIKDTEVATLMLNRTITILIPYFQDFTFLDWQDWFQVNLAPLLSGVNVDILSALPQNISCESYQAIIQAFDSVFTSLSLEQSKAVFSFAEGYLQHVVQNGVACALPGQDSLGWLVVNFGQFSIFAQYSDFVLLNYNFNWFEVLQVLTPVQLADVTVVSTALSNSTEIQLFFSYLVKENAVDNFAQYFSELSSKNISITNSAVREFMMYTTFNIISLHFPDFGPSDWDQWFQVYLIPVLSSMNATMLTITTTGISCTDYQAIIQGLNRVYNQMSATEQDELTQVLVEYLKGTAAKDNGSGSSCVSQPLNNRVWLIRNFGNFSIFASYMDFTDLNNNFTAFDALDLMTVTQLAQFSAIPGALKSSEDVNNVMSFINVSSFGQFFDVFSPAVQAYSDFSMVIKTDLLQVVLTKVFNAPTQLNMTNFLLWIKQRLSPLLPALSQSQVSLLFNPAFNLSYQASQALQKVLGSINYMLNVTVQREIYKNILISLTVPTPLFHYKGGNFLVYLNNTLGNFNTFLTLSGFFSIIPPSQLPQLMNTIPPAQLSIFLSVPGVIDDTSLFLKILNYTNLATFIDNFNNATSQANLPNNIKTAILTAAWPTAILTNKQSDLNLWFGTRLNSYIGFLNLNIFNATLNATCPAFSKIISLLGSKTLAYLQPSDVYNMIKKYLTLGTLPKCFDPTNPLLNSTAWFANYIGNFIIYTSKNDLELFASTETLMTFTTSKQNLKLFSNTAIPKDVLEFYISLLFAAKPHFNLTKLPDALLCYAPINSFLSSVNLNNVAFLSAKFIDICNTTLFTQFLSSMAGNTPNITADVIAFLGTQSSDLTVTQILQTDPSVILQSVSILSQVPNWNQEQAKEVIQKLLSSGYQVNSDRQLIALGTLTQGLTTSAIQNINSAAVLGAIQNTTFVQNLLLAPQVIQQLFVNKIIAANPSPNVVLQNVPANLASLIPVSSLFFTGSNIDLQSLNQKNWTPEQAALFYYNVMISTKNYQSLSSFVLQGYSGASVKNLSSNDIIEIIKAYNGKHVTLVEQQLTSMAYYLNNQTTLQNFSSYPPEVLLYYQYSKITDKNCIAYFKQIGNATLLESTGTLKQAKILLKSAKQCLGIKSTNISSKNLSVLNNMVCTLNGTYIENSDCSILEYFKNCSTLTPDQASSIQTVLLKGNTTYGKPSNWTIQTLLNLGELPFYFNRIFWSKFKVADIITFLEVFVPKIKLAKINKSTLTNLYKQLSPTRQRRDTSCTTGNITTDIIKNSNLEIQYDVSQFCLCLSPQTVNDNLALLVENIYLEPNQQCILDKLNEQYPYEIPEIQLQMLGPVSRLATLEDIDKWTVTQVDTLTELLNPSDGSWPPDKSALLITKFLNAGNTFNSATLKAIGGENLCSVDISVLEAIDAQELRDAVPLNISSCSYDKQQVLYNKICTAYNLQTITPLQSFIVLKDYLGGAPRKDILTFASGNINMDMSTFLTLDTSIINQLSVANVNGLLGYNTKDLVANQNNPKIQAWMENQPRAAINSLNLGLQGGYTINAPSGVMNFVASIPEKSSANLMLPNMLWTIFMTVAVFVLQIVL
ncbi:uncharacterized protein LOC114661228 [Erpetoichthys calabaricus]|uniref:uncharacterized protein LOC114661228 n=1 Tax=Erpetoichthys calabaricus TaxID=27687 RepID=UPI002233E622|nr:uncharacterized protein LOC114661228 [Erpetoichthys calabaricus]